MSDFYRFPIPAQICGCGCSRPRHDHSRKGEPCDACSCDGFTHRWNDWTETRKVREVAP